MAERLMKSLKANRVVREWLLVPPEPILHDSVARIQFFGLVLLLASPAALWFWGHYLHQPQESTFLRLSAALLAVPLAMPSIQLSLSRRMLECYWLFMCWYALPFTCLLLYRANGFTEVWMGTVVAMIYLVFQLTDWRLAILSIVLGALGAFVVEKTIFPLPWGVPPLPIIDQLPVIAFAFLSALGLALSSSNLRRERMRASLITIGVIAHEMRTPILSASIIAGKLSQASTEAQRAVLSEKIQDVFRSMNAMIDYQMTNVRLTDLPQQREVVDLGSLVREAVTWYPIANRVSRASVTGEYEGGLMVSVHPLMMRQVVHNLLRNAVSAVQATGRPPAAGDVHVVVSADPAGRGACLDVKDRGVGISPDRMTTLFEPFNSTSATPSHGLGLTMCRNSITSFQGEIWCTSVVGEGSTFHVLLPFPRDERGWRFTPPAALRALDPKNWP